MRHIVATVLAYLTFNLAIWLAIGEGGILALAFSNGVGGLITLAFFWKSQVVGKGKPNMPVALLGAVGILLIVFGLRSAHTSLPVSLSMELVYNGFAISSWPMFLALGFVWPKSFSDKPNAFDLACHMAMACLVTMRFGTYEGLHFNTSSLINVVVAIAGYALFNVSIKLAKGHRATNVAMNLSAACLLSIFAFASGDAGHWTWDGRHMGGALLGCVAIFGIVHQLGASYAYFGSRKQGSLVAPLVYDGILVASPLVMLVTGEKVQGWTLILAAGMLAVTTLRYRHHTR